jgi:hypothetical protein
VIPLRRLELKEYKSFNKDSRVLYADVTKPPHVRVGYNMFADYDRQVILVDGIVLPFAEASHWYEAEEPPPATSPTGTEPPPKQEVIARCERCGRDFSSLKALGGHKPHCNG